MPCVSVGVAILRLEEKIGRLVFIGLSLVEVSNHKISCNKCTYNDSQRHNIALILPVDYLAGRTPTAKKGMGILSPTVTTRSFDGSKHSFFLSCWQLLPTPWRLGFVFGTSKFRGYDSLLRC